MGRSDLRGKGTQEYHAYRYDSQRMLGPVPYAISRDMALKHGVIGT